MLPLLQALAFFTRLPVPARAHGPWRAGMAAWLPVVGLLVGGLAAAAAWGAAHVFHSGIAAILGALAWVLVTGGLHLDGVADCGDGLACAADKDKRLEIMRDPRVGTFGFLALFFTLILKVAALGQLTGGSPKQLVCACLLAGLLARGLAVSALASQPMARAGGLGEAFRQTVRPWELVVSKCCMLVAFGVACFLFPSQSLWALLAALFFHLGLLHLAKRKIGGISGDVLGALVEGVETVVLLAFCAKGAA